MKVLDLRCERGHQFEGWFSSEDDYQTQRAKGMLTCPVCDSLHVEKRLSAPYVAMKSNRQTEARPKPVAQRTQQQVGAEPTQAITSSAQAAPNPEQQQAFEAMHAQWLAYSRAVMAKAEDVGSDFAQEARKIHEGQAPERLIHGQASMDEVAELIEEGVPVLPMAAQAKEPLQ